MQSYFLKSIESQDKEFLEFDPRGKGSEFFLNNEKFPKRYSMNNDKIAYIKFHCNPTVKSSIIFV